MVRQEVRPKRIAFNINDEIVEDYSHCNPTESLSMLQIGIYIYLKTTKALKMSFSCSHAML
jgi:hypothetical protein